MGLLTWVWRLRGGQEPGRAVPPGGPCLYCPSCTVASRLFRGRGAAAASAGTSTGRIPVVAAYDPGQWHDFATSFAAAAGALLGLAFVAISFNLDTILKFKALPGRAVETLAFFAYALAASLLIQLPGVSSVALGIGQAILAAGIAGLAVRGVPRWRQERGDPLSWRLTHLGPAVVIALLAVVGAVATMTTSLGGLYWLAAAMTVAVASGIINSWVLLVEIKR